MLKRTDLSRERINVLTHVFSDPNIVVKLAFGFKEKDTRTHQWAPKLSYRLEQLLGTISNLPNPHHIFTLKNYRITVFT